MYVDLPPGITNGTIFKDSKALLFAGHIFLDCKQNSIKNTQNFEQEMFFENYSSNTHIP